MTDFELFFCFMCGMFAAAAYCAIGFWFKTVKYLLTVNVFQKIFEDSTRRANEKDSK